METRPYSFLFQAGPIESSDIVSFRLTRELGRPAEMEILVRTEGAIDPDELLGAPAHFVFGRDAAEHAFDGVVAAVTVSATADDDDERAYVHRLHVTSVIGLLDQEVDFCIYQDKDVKEIVSEVLRDLGIDDEHQAWRRAGSYPKREYCVQYGESALAFVSRLLEEEGLYFYSEASDKGDVVVFEDDSTASDPIEGDKVVPYRFGAGLSSGDDAIDVITERYRTTSGKVVLRDYDFKKPDADLTAEAVSDSDDDLEVYDYPGLFTELSEGQRLARVRLQAVTAERATLSIRSTCSRISAGRWLEVTDAETDVDGEYFVTSSLHTLQAGVLVVTATLIPRKVPYRSPRRTPLPVIDGPQTAVVVAPPGSPAEEIHVDEHGRCKVQFHWDLYGENDDKSSCWMRVSQAQTSGSMIFPRVGWEVIVEFLEGNPDRPIITGRAYNGRWMPPYALPEGKSRMAIQTSSSPGGGGRNEIRFEDKAGSEEISIQSQKDTTLATGNNKKKSVAVNETKNVAVDATLSVGANQTIQVTNGFQSGVAGSQTVSVAANRKVEVNAVYGLTAKGASATSVAGNQMEMDGNPIQALLSLAAAAATAAVKAEMARGLQALDQAVQQKVNQVMGPLRELEGQVQNVSAGLEAVSNGDLGGAAGALSAAAGLPTPGGFGAKLAPSADGGGEPGMGRSAEGGRGEGPGREGGASGGRGGAAESAGGGGPVAGLNAMVQGALSSGRNALGDALGLGGGGGGGSSEANASGPEGAVGSNAAADSATGPGHAINVCSSTHTETVGSLKATIAAAGIHTTVKSPRSQKVGAIRAELVAGQRVESCSADKTEKALGLVVVSGSPEEETVGASRTTMVGGAILQKIGGSHTVTAGGKALFVGAFHKIDASGSIVLKCGGSEVVIDGGGVTIKSAQVNIAAPTIKLTKPVAEA